MKAIYNYIILILILSLFTSCEEEKMLDLNTTEPHVVIDASITEDGFCQVKLSLSQSFYNNEPYKTISGATIVLTEGGFKTETLKEDERKPGLYASSGIYGIVGVDYNLKVIIGDKTYEANATVPTKVPLQAIHLYEVKAGDKSWFSPSVEFDDPADESNYYYFKMTVNEREIQTVYINDDEFRNGKRIHRVLYFDEEANDGEDLKLGDVVDVEMQTLDYGMYNFYQTWLSYAGGNANPATNFTGGALGCFKAYNTDWMTMIVDASYIYEENN